MVPDVVRPLRQAERCPIKYVEFITWELLKSDILPETPILEDR